MIGGGRKPDTCNKYVCHVMGRFFSVKFQEECNFFCSSGNKKDFHQQQISYFGGKADKP